MIWTDYLPIAMFAMALILILRSYPVGYVLGGVGILFFLLASSLGVLNFRVVNLVPARIFGIMSNSLLLAIPYFIFMGKLLEKSKLANQMLIHIGKLFGSLKGGLGITVIIVGALLAASTSVVAASVVTMGAITLPVMLKQGYSKQYSTGIIAASGTLGQIIPPSIVLIFLADQMKVPVGDLFLGALLPGALLCGLFIVYTLGLGLIFPKHLPAKKMEGSFKENLWDTCVYSLPVLVLIICVLGSIFLGIATPTEAGAIGVVVTAFIAYLYDKEDLLGKIKSAALETVQPVASIMAILVGSTIFSLMFKFLEGDVLLRSFLLDLPGDTFGFILVVSLFVFVLGFFLDFFEIVFIVVPLILPIAQELQIDLVWFAILISLNIQASFITPPFGFSLFFLRSVTPKEIPTKTIYKGIIPFVVIQLICIVLVYLFPQLILRA